MVSAVVVLGETEEAQQRIAKWRQEQQLFPLCGSRAVWLLIQTVTCSLRVSSENDRPWAPKGQGQPWPFYLPLLSAFSLSKACSTPSPWLPSSLFISGRPFNRWLQMTLFPASQRKWTNWLKLSLLHCIPYKPTPSSILPLPLQLLLKVEALHLLSPHPTLALSHLRAFAPSIPLQLLPSYWLLSRSLEISANLPYTSLTWALSSDHNLSIIPFSSHSKGIAYSSYLYFPISPSFFHPLNSGFCLYHSTDYSGKGLSRPHVG